MSDRERSISSKEDDIFHSVTMVEQSTWEKSYTEGVEQGRKKGFDEGFKLGAEKGSQLGNEVGFYAGYAAYILKVPKDGSTRSSRVTRLCESIQLLADQFPSLEPTDEALTDNLSKLQSKFKQLTSLLGVSVEYKTTTGSSTGVSF